MTEASSNSNIFTGNCIEECRVTASPMQCAATLNQNVISPDKRSVSIRDIAANCTHIERGCCHAASLPELIPNVILQERANVNKQIQEDNKVHAWTFYVPAQFKPSFSLIVLDDDNLCAAVCQKLYAGTKGAAKLRRIGPQCPSIEIIVRCKYLFGLQNAGSIPLKEPNPFLAMYAFDTRNTSEIDGIPMYHARPLILRYYYHIATIKIPSTLSNCKVFFAPGVAVRRIRAWKTSMAAYIVHSFVRNVERGLGAVNKLVSYQTEWPAMYWCFIIPVVHTMVMMMDNERPTNLQMNEILNYNVKNFMKRIIGEVTKVGIWSVERLIYEKHKHGKKLTSTVGNEMAQGLHYMVAKIFFMLNTTDGPLRGLDHDKNWITKVQKTNMLKDIDGWVKYRCVTDM